MIRRSIGNTIKLISIRNARRQRQQINMCNIDHCEISKDSKSNN